MTVIEIPPQSGVAFSIDRGQILRVIDPEGEQVADLTALSRAHPRSLLSSGKSIDFAGRIYLTDGDTLYSNLCEPMFRIVEDTVGRHDLLLAPCSQETFDILYEGHQGHHPSCLENLSTALEVHGVCTSQVGSTFNIFMDVAVGSDGTIDIRPPASKAGDHVDFLAEMPLLVGLTACSAEKTNNGRLKPIRYMLL